MPKFKVAVTWVMTAEIAVEAASLKEAISTVEGADGLPNGEYLDDSYQVDEDATRELNDEPGFLTLTISPHCNYHGTQHERFDDNCFYEDSNAHR